jgi:hypothetical protein
VSQNRSTRHHLISDPSGWSRCHKLPTTTDQARQDLAHVTAEMAAKTCRWYT